MAHFYSGIQGQAGEATRMGSKASGISGYVQSWGARLTVSMDHNSHHDTDTAHFRLHDGPSNHDGGALSMTFRDATTIVNALGTGDKKINAIRERIYREVERLNEEAPKAVKRAKRKAEAERKRQFREEQAKIKTQKDIIRDMQPEEKARIVRLLNVELDREGNFEDYEPLLRANIREAESHIVIDAKLGQWHRVSFDVTAGQWIVPFDPAEIGRDNDIEESGFGYRVEEVVA